MEIAEIFDIYWSSDVCIASGLHSDLSRMQAEVGPGLPAMQLIEAVYAVMSDLCRRRS